MESADEVEDRLERATARAEDDDVRVNVRTVEYDTPLRDGCRDDRLDRLGACGGDLSGSEGLSVRFAHLADVHFVHGRRRDRTPSSPW